MASALPVIIKNGQYDVLDPAKLESMPLAQYYQDYRNPGTIVNAQADFFYDTAYIVAGTAVTANQKQALFAHGKTDPSSQFNGAPPTAIAEKGAFMTNMLADGSFPQGTSFIMEGAGVQILMTADKATAALGTRGEMLTPVYAASVTKSAVNNLLAALENLELIFFRGEEPRKRGPLEFWPAPPGVGLEGASGSPNGGFFQNGRGGLVQFSHPVFFQSLDPFYFMLANIADQAWTPDMDIKVRVILWGQSIKTFYPG
jgi:hypothetical protein